MYSSRNDLGNFVRNVNWLKKNVLVYRKKMVCYHETICSISSVGI